MSSVALSLIESERLDDRAPAPEASRAASDSLRPLSRAQEALSKLTMTLAVWFLYVPHLAFLNLLGPRLGPRWARVVGRLHWLLTFLGGQHAVRDALQKMHPHLQNRHSINTILRKHLELKHECFAGTKLFNRRELIAAPGGLEWVVEPAIAQRMRELRASGRPLIIIGFHFGFFRLSATALSRVIPGCDAIHVCHRIAHYEPETIGRIAQLALEKALIADERSGARMHYVENDSSAMRICRLLLSGEVVALAADGAFAKDFLDVPFFNAKLRFPCGWARLAAATRSNVVILADTQIDNQRRKARLFELQHVVDNSTESIYGAVAQAARVLEELIHCEPWSWHPWQRVQFQTDDGGQPVLVIKELGRGRNRLLRSPAGNGSMPKLAGDMHLATNRTAKAGTTSFASNRNGSAAMHIDSELRTESNQELGTRARRVAIVANSFTPYRIYVHSRIVREVPEVELSTVMTHGNSYGRWQGLEPPPEIRPVTFGNGEPTIEQTRFRFAFREWRKFGQIIRWLERNKIEAVICQGFGDVGRLRLMRWCYRRGIPCFLTADCNICGDVAPGPRRLLKHLVVGQAIRWSSGVMPCGEYGRLLFERYGATRDKTFMFPLISSLDLFANPPDEMRRQVREEFGLDPKRRRILYCGRMMNVKRPDLTMGAFVALAKDRPDWDLVMIGEGPLRQATAATVPAGLKDRVKWLGLVHDTSKLASVYAECDVLVLPADKEPWGMVVIEAAAAGLALVTTDIVGVMPELVSDGENGRVFPRGDLDGFIAALREVTEADRIDEMKRNSRRVLARWMAESDPVDGFRNAMVSCGLIPHAPSVRVAERHSFLSKSTQRGHPLEHTDHDGQAAFTTLESAAS